MLLVIGGQELKEKHLTSEQRSRIQNGLNSGKSFKEIGREIGKDCTSVSREVRRNLTAVQKGCYGKSFNDCALIESCTLKEGCDDALCSKSRCRGCKAGCNSQCKQYVKKVCQDLLKPPYVCNSCKKIMKCSIEKRFYNAAEAQESYRKLLSNARSGFSIDEETRKSLEPLIKDYTGRGFSVHAMIAAEGEDVFGFCEKTLYTYIDSGVFRDVGNYSLPRKIRYRPRRKNERARVKVDKKCAEGRTFADFKKFVRANPDTPIIQMDMVEGKKGIGEKVILTIHFLNCNLMLMFLRDFKAARNVESCFCRLKTSLGTERYKTLFRLILTDNGSEFSDPEPIETSPETGELLCPVFYCEPNRSDQKGACEVNHEMIRRVIPKGVSLNPCTQEDISKLMNHINSYPRESLGNRTPYEMFVFLYGEESADKLGLRRIDNKDTNLKPSLLN